MNDERDNKKIPWLEAREEGLVLTDGEISLMGDFTKNIKRLQPENLNRELIVKAAKKGLEKNQEKLPLALDCTAGLGEDSILIAAAGFRVRMYEYNFVIAALLRDALDRGMKDERITHIVSRMELVEGDSIKAMEEMAEKKKGEVEIPDIILLDPMFPERQKSGLVKKKFQLLQRLEAPARDEETLLDSAIKVGPRKILIKRPIKGPYLSEIRPSYSLEGSVIRIDCIVR